MRTAHLVAVLMLGAVACRSVAADPPSRKSANDLPEIAELPNPFTLADGSAVRTQDDWQRRRVELQALFEDYLYGSLPPKPEKMTVQPGERATDETNKVAIQDLELKLEHQGKTLTIEVRIALPPGAEHKVPVVIQGAFPRWPGQPSGPPPGERFAAYTGRGYAVAEIDFQQVAADNKDQARTSGIYHLFGDQIDCGALMAWAWGMHRVLDALETIPEVDAAKAVVTGHSRYGKAALIAGAFDERIALTVPSHSGCAGAAPYRFIYGSSEQLHNIVGAFPHWFRPDFNQFVGNVDRLPVDQHLLKALVAPRALLDTEGTQDAWTNPQGAQLTHLAAKKVYDFVRAPGAISIRYRPVGHIPSIEDLLDYADHVFYGKPLSDEFGKLPYPEEPKGFTWDVPR